MQPPSVANFWTSIFPVGTGYATPFSQPQARKELLNYARVLSETGAKIYLVEDVLLEGTVDKNGNPLPGQKLTNLQDFAKEFLEISLEESAKGDAKSLDEYKDKAIRSLHPEALLQLIMQNPTITVRKDKLSITDFYSEYALEPLADLFYTRDQVITTAKGVVFGRFRTESAEKESSVVKFILNKLGVEPIYEITGEGTLEGGDFFMAGDTAFIGEGPRTNAEGVRQLLDNKVLGVDRLVVVQDHLMDPAQMHLDTYFNIAGPGLSVLSVERMKGDNNNPVAATVDVYEMENGAYVQKENGRDFAEYLEEVLKYKVIPVSIPDQRALATNFLTVAPFKVVVPDGASQEYKDALRKAGVDATWVDMTNIVRGFGAAHCTTQGIYRSGT